MQSRSTDPTVSRRTLLGSAIAGAVAARDIVAQSSAASGPARVKGPAVWLDMDQQELDDAYTKSVYAPNMQQVLGRFVTNSDAARRRLGEPRRYSYGRTPIEGLDVYLTGRQDAPINIFIHGGAWRAGTAREHGFLAELFVNAGAHFVVLDFINVLAAEGSLEPMVAQVRAAIAWVYENARVFGGDPARIFVSGQSSGGHLAGVVATTDWQRDFGLPADVIKGTLCCSGVYDLQPVRLSVRSSYVKVTDAIERELSPQRHVDKLNGPVLVAHGTFETPEFQRQARDFVAAIQVAGKTATLLIGDGYNHFELLETLSSPYGVVGRAVLELMDLS
jgi:arylformamidase